MKWFAVLAVGLVASAPVFATMTKMKIILDYQDIYTMSSATEGKLTETIFSGSMELKSSLGEAKAPIEETRQTATEGSIKIEGKNVSLVNEEGISMQGTVAKNNDKNLVYKVSMEDTYYLLNPIRDQFRDHNGDVDIKVKKVACTKNAQQMICRGNVVLKIKAEM